MDGIEHTADARAIVALQRARRNVARRMYDGRDAGGATGSVALVGAGPRRPQ